MPVLAQLTFGWLWITLGLLSGMLLGLGFHQEGWLGGYQAFPRRMVRLGHISFVALGALNVLFALTVERVAAAGTWPGLAAVAWVCGAVAMPTCCGLVAFRPRLRLLFGVPITFLVSAAVLTSWFCLQAGSRP